MEDRSFDKTPLKIKNSHVSLASFTTYSWIEAKIENFCFFIFKRIYT